MFQTSALASLFMLALATSGSGQTGEEANSPLNSRDTLRSMRTVQKTLALPTFPTTLSDAWQNKNGETVSVEVTSEHKLRLDNRKCASYIMNVKKTDKDATRAALFRGVSCLDPRTNEWLSESVSHSRWTIK